jgi:two-component system nitrogen regulation response regulator GlnG
MVDEVTPHEPETLLPDSDPDERDAVRVPCLTVLCHPDMARVGDRVTLDALHAGRTIGLSRDAPIFAEPRGARAAPLGSRYVSASRPIELRGRPDGVEIRPYSGARITVDDVPLEGVRVVSLGELRGGVGLVLANRIALWLHTIEVERPAVPSLGLIGESDAIDALRRRILNVADLDVSVLVRGESGSGKELVAGAIWRASKRAGGAFEACNMSSVPDGNLGLSALFGHVKGAFTGASARFRGLLERNHGGTVFLDEIGACDGQVQDRLLRVLEDGSLIPIGTEQAQRIDVRVLSATDAALEAMLASGTFRAPLYHRLARYVIDVPPLSARRDDVARLVVHFLRQSLAEIGESSRLAAADEGARPWFPADLMALLVRHDWSGGNVRALQNAVGRIVIDHRGRDALDVAAVRRQLVARPAVRPPSFPEALEPPEPASVRARRSAQPRDLSRAELVAALRDNDYSAGATAKALGRPKATIHSWMQQLGIRLVKDIPPEELALAYEAQGRNLAATARHFEVSVRALSMRLRELGVEVTLD